MNPFTARCLMPTDFWWHVNLWLSLVLLVFGLALLVCMAFEPKTMATWLRARWWARGAPKLLALPATIIAALRTQGIDKDKEQWVLPAILGGVCLAIWELVQVRVEMIREAEAKAEQDKLEEATERNAKMTRKIHDLSTLSAGLMKTAERKTQRLIAARGRRAKGRAISAACEAFDTTRQLKEVLEAILDYFKITGHRRGREGSIRVYLYVENGSGELEMVSEATADGPVSIARAPKSWQAHKEHFAVANANDASLAVRCVRSNHMIVIPDCVKAHDDPAHLFKFFRPEQRDYLKSLVAFPVPDAVNAQGSGIKACVVADSDFAGFFEYEEEQLHGCLREFAARIALELASRAMLV